MFDFPMRDTQVKIQAFISIHILTCLVWSDGRNPIACTLWFLNFKSDTNKAVRGKRQPAYATPQSLNPMSSRSWINFWASLSIPFFVSWLLLNSHQDILVGEHMNRHKYTVTHSVHDTSWCTGRNRLLKPLHHLRAAEMRTVFVLDEEKSLHTRQHLEVLLRQRMNPVGSSSGQYNRQSALP